MDMRPRSGGVNRQVPDEFALLIALAGAGGGAMSGVVMTATSFQILSLIGGILAMLLVPVLLWARRSTTV